MLEKQISVQQKARDFPLFFLLVGYVYFTFAVTIPIPLLPILMILADFDIDLSTLYPMFFFAGFGILSIITALFLYPRFRKMGISQFRSILLTGIPVYYFLLQPIYFIIMRNID